MDKQAWLITKLKVGMATLGSVAAVLTARAKGIDNINHDSVPDIGEGLLLKILKVVLAMQTDGMIYLLALI